MLVHHVFFWLKNPDSAEDQAQLKKGLLALEAIDVVRQLHVGTPAPPDRPNIDRSYAFSLLIIFDDLAGHDVYQAHPLHRNFIKEHAHLWSKVVVYDAA